MNSKRPVNQQVAIQVVRILVRSEDRQHLQNVPARHGYIKDKSRAIQKSPSDGFLKIAFGKNLSLLKAVKLEKKRKEKKKLLDKMLDKM